MSSKSSNNPSLPSFPEFPDFYRVGWVQSAHGLRGELYVRLNAKSADWRRSAERLFLLPAGASEPRGYGVRQLKPHKDGLIARLEDIQDRDAAELMAKAQVYIPRRYLQAEPGETIFLGQINGFSLTGRDGVLIGTIVGFSSNGPQDLLRLERASGRYAGRETLVPFVEAFLVDIDFDGKRVTMDLPPGLIDLEDE